MVHLHSEVPCLTGLSWPRRPSSINSAVVKMRICRKCGEEKPLDHFSKDSRVKNGFTRMCKSCLNKQIKERGQIKPRISALCEQCNAEFLAFKYDVEKKGGGRFCSRICRNRFNGINTSNIQTSIEGPKPSESKIAKQAQGAVNRGLKSGSLKKKPCEKCGKENVDAHHPNYSKPLDVIWLCRRHHQMEHGAK
ncbi:hypothetical protein LCGC14_1059390 [marine sediment metagenome]|uniref:Uncharacterized protein n=1 Tax=marine sediment metagenome TaxID=412755 RepID=A0A0F9N8G6_9ZZZZ